MTMLMGAVRQAKWFAIAIFGLLVIMPVIAENDTATTYFWSFGNCTATPSVIASPPSTYNKDDTYWITPSFNETTGATRMKIHLAGIPLQGATIVTQMDVRGNSFNATSTTQSVQFVWHLSVDAYIKSTDTNAYSQLSVVGRLYKSDNTLFASPVGMSWGVTSRSDGSLVQDELRTFYVLNTTYSGLTIGQEYTLDTMLVATVHVPSMQSGYPYGEMNIDLGPGSETGLQNEIVS